MKENKENCYEIEYRFDFEGKRPDIEFHVLLGRTNLIALPPEGSREHEWTLLDFNKCSICPLSSSEVRNCPIAFNLSGLAEIFSEMVSYDQAIITVNVEERSYMKRDTIQQGARSILGIYMASSGCPHMAILKPMVRFHLPFASHEESLYRHVTSYLLNQYFEYLNGKRPDIDLEKLEREQDNVDLVNRGIFKRFQGISPSDVNRNALVILNTFSVMIKMGIEGKLEQLKYLFK
ncbi:MAG: hypothetical protein PHD54_02965 [Desulfuromonadaceae bacterium]|nr:hypothetical protein [Desulfuromonadaceae bacterium]